MRRTAAAPLVLAGLFTSIGARAEGAPAVAAAASVLASVQPAAAAEPTVQGLGVPRGASPAGAAPTGRGASDAQTGGSAPPATTAAGAASTPDPASGSGALGGSRGDVATADGASLGPSAEEGAWRFGVTAGIVALPRPISLALHATWKRRWGVVLTGGYLPRFEYFENSSISMWGVDAEARWFPTGGHFFVGLGLGFQQTALTYRLFNNDNTGDVSSLHATARVGWLWVLRSGLAFSVDVGLQSPMIASGFSGTKSVTVKDIYGILKDYPLPNASLFRLGYFF